MSIPRMNYRQYRKARKLTHECCNYCDGNCLLLDDGEECVCVQSISYSLLCRWFLRRMRGRVHAEVQPGQILPGLRGADAPEERGRTAAAKIPVFGRKEMNTHEKSHADKNMSTICVGLVNERPTNLTNNSV